MLWYSFEVGGNVNLTSTVQIQATNATFPPNMYLYRESDFLNGSAFNYIASFGGDLGFDAAVASGDSSGPEGVSAPAELDGFEGQIFTPAPAGRYVLAIGEQFLYSFDAIFGTNFGGRNGGTFDLTISEFRAGGAPLPITPIAVGGSRREEPTDTEARRVAFTVGAPSGIDTVEWINVPTPSINGLYGVGSIDYVRHELFGDAAYQAIVDAGLTELQFDVTTGCGTSSVLSLPINPQPDPAPSVAFAQTSPLNYNVAEHNHLSVILSDAGRNLSKVEALLFVPGTTDTPIAVIGQHEWASEPISLDSFDFRLPVRLWPPLGTGTYELRLRVEDRLGQTMLSAPRVLTISPPLAPPRLTLTDSGIRAPAGQVGQFDYNIVALGLIDRIEVSVSGAVDAPSTQVIELAEPASNASGSVDVLVGLGAVSGDEINVTVDAYTSSGQVTSETLVVIAGAWGEQTISLSGDARADRTFAYADVLTNGNDLRIDQSIPFNNLTVDSDGYVFIEAPYPTLKVRETLRIESGGEVRAETNSETVRVNGEHGGDSGGSSNANAYGDFRAPRFPGGSAVEPFSLRTRRNGGGVLLIEADRIVLDGHMSADGESAGNGSSFIGSGAGGTVNIRVRALEGEGSVSAKGGDMLSFSGRAAGAGGRIAIVYDTYQGGSDSPTTDMSFDVSSGAAITASDEAGRGDGVPKRKRSS